MKRVVFFIFLLICALNIFCQNSDDFEIRKRLTEDYLYSVNDFSKYTKFKSVQKAQEARKHIVESFDKGEGTPVVIDIEYLISRIKPIYKQQTLLTYINKLDSLSKTDYIEIAWDEKGFDYKGHILYLPIKVYYKNKGEGYSCMAKFYFSNTRNGCKINSIEYSGFKRLVSQPPPTGEDGTGKETIICRKIGNISLGWMVDEGITMAVGIEGLSKNWFINHLRFGVEYNMLFNQEGDAHYPTSTDGAPATMTYRTRKNDDYGLGINIGYRIIPGKYDNVSILGGHGRLFLSMGGGIIRYGRWWEYQGASAPIEHPRNTAIYIKPSVTLEYLLSDFCGIGVEASYYYSPQYSQINGVGLNISFNYAF